MLGSAQWLKQKKLNKKYLTKLIATVNHLLVPPIRVQKLQMQGQSKMWFVMLCCLVKSGMTARPQ